MPRFPHHQAAVAWAKGELGITEHPPGSNRGDRVQFYQAHTWLPGTGWPWCVAFLQTAWQEGGIPLPWKTAGAYNLGDLARKQGWTTTTAKLIPGDIVVWKIGAGHASMFLGYDKAKGIVKTIDGNVSDSVAYRERPLRLIRDAIHVPEDPVSVAKIPPAKPPVYEVTTSESGTAKIVYVSGPKAVARKLAELLRRFGEITIRRKAGS